MADPEQARAANERSLAFAQDGMAADALTEGAQAATLYRQLIAAHPDEYDADPDSYRDDYDKAVELLDRVRVS